MSKRKWKPRTPEQREQARLASAAYRARHRDRARDSVSRYYKSRAPEIRLASRERERLARALNPEKYRNRDRAFYRSNPGKIKAKNLRQKYGLSVAQWLSMIHFQDYKCAICRTGHPGKHNWAVDHEHESGHIRGVLCHACNLRLGNLGDTKTEIEVHVNRIKNYLTEAAATS